jgi:predicted enzyme related to lactoylglutathione lyase
MRRRKISAFVLDCRVDDLATAAEFWSHALGRAVRDPDQDGDGKYAELETDADEPFLLLQRVDHEPRIHLDIESDDFDADIARLEALGAKRIAFVKRWWVMEAPTGHRFCLIRKK